MKENWEKIITEAIKKTKDSQNNIAKKIEVFLRDKENFLKKPDKSRKKSLDEKIVGLIMEINKIPYYYTTSSCSGRIMVFQPGEKKHETKWLFVSHDLVDGDKVKEIKKIVESMKGRDVWFKFESPILHVSCYSLEWADLLAKIFRESGWKRTTILNISPKIIVEATTALNIAGPLWIVKEDLIEDLIEEANKKLEKGWELIEKAKKSVGEILPIFEKIEKIEK